MDDSRGIFCRLCFNTVSKEDFTIIDQSIKEMLRTVSPNMESVDNYKHVICSSCSVKLYAAFDFKYTCLYFEDRITSYVDPKVSFVDLREVYLKEQNDKTVKMKDHQRICRLCLQLVKKIFVSFHEINLDMINNYIPELNFSATQDPVVCQQCFDSLSANETFIRTCLDVEMKICNTDDKIRNPECENNEVKLGNEEIKERIIKIKNEPEKAEMLIKSEEIDIKVEDEEPESDSFPYDVSDEAIENKMQCSFEDVGETTNKSVDKCEAETELSKDKSLLDLSSNKSNYKIDVNNHQIHETVQNSLHHQLIKNPSKAVMHKRDACTYETKRRSLLRTHHLSHKGTEEVGIYKCESCDFTTKFKENLELHLSLHKYSPDFQIYKCDSCTYETRHKRLMIGHQLTHKDLSKIQMYQCDTCSYVTRHRSNLRDHQLTHKDRSQVQMYKCSTCTYETKYKYHLKNIS